MKRPLYGLVSLFAALILVRASSYGAVGRVIEHTGDRLIGSAGVALLVVILMLVAYHLLVPRSVRRWLLTFPELFHREALKPQVVRAAPRRAPARQRLVVVTGAELQGLGLQGLLAGMQGAPPSYAGLQNHQMTVPEAAMLREANPRPRARQVVEVPEVVPVRSPAERMRLTDVETALKGLGYRKEEYKFVQEMDGKLPIETLVRDSLAKLRKS